MPVHLPENKVCFSEAADQAVTVRIRQKLKIFSLLPPTTGGALFGVGGHYHFIVTDRTVGPWHYNVLSGNRM